MTNKQQQKQNNNNKKTKQNALTYTTSTKQDSFCCDKFDVKI